MLFPFILGLAVVTALLLAILIWRARKPMMLPALSAVDIKIKESKFNSAWRTLLKALDYLATQRELRYHTPWVLVVGQRGVGKSSLLASINTTLWQTPSENQAKLVLEGSTWRFLPHGVLIDPPGQLSAAQAGSKLAKEWQDLLKKLDNLRPERPIDSIMLVISARSLQDDTAQERLTLAESLRAQLVTLEQQTEFALPVYIVISETDAIVGFSAFWQTQSPALRSEMFGWSMPGLIGSNQLATWADLAFDSLGERLKLLQMQAAAESGHMDVSQVDQFFLFPRHFQQLRTPLQHCLNVLFQASSWQSGGVFRGVYFTGQITENSTATAQHTAHTNDGLPRNDISFIDDLIIKKVLAEPYLGRPTRSGIWSRNKLIRQCQIASVSLFSVLLLSLGTASILLQRQTEALQAGLRGLQKIEQRVANIPSAPEQCMPKELVFQSIQQIAQIQSNTVYWAIPASWMDRHLTHDSAQLIANGVLQKVVLSGIACRLEQQAQVLMATPTPKLNATRQDSGVLIYTNTQKDLFEYSQKIELFQQNMASFQQISTTPVSLKTKPLLGQFIALANYAYQAELPKSLAQEQGTLNAALAQTQYLLPLNIPNDIKSRLSQKITNIAKQLLQEMYTEVETGNRLLQELQQESDQILPSARHFTSWLQWVSSEWAVTGDGDNPCKTVEKKLNERVKVLRNYGYPETDLQKMLEYFGAANCSQPNISKLSAMQMAPYGSLFSRINKGLTLNPQLINELAGLKSLVLLNFMQIPSAKAFLCQTKVAGWRASEIGLSNNYVEEYDKFIHDLSAVGSAPNSAYISTATNTNQANATSQRPLYQRLALRQLERAMNNNLSQAQVIAGSVMVAVNPSALGDQALAEESSNFSALIEPLLSLQRSYRAKEFAASETQVSQCIANYASNSLGRIQNLSDISRLYESTSHLGAGTLFELGTTPVIKDFLSRQLARTQVLAGYATPFLSYLNNSSGQNLAPNNNTQSAAYWTNTINELNSYVQFKEPTGQVAQLDYLYLKQMPNLDSANCSKTMAAYKPIEYGNDLFSVRRLKLESQIQANCQGERNTLALNTYNDLAARFNRELAGRYPFGPMSGQDANLTTTRNFFADYAGQSASLRQSLQGLPGTYWNSARQFLAQLDASAKFFRGTLNLSPAAPAPGAPPAKAPETEDDENAGLASQPIKLNIQFHAQANNSPGADQLVAWSLTSGSKSAAFPNRSSSLDWEYGQAMVLDLTWASGSLWSPATDLQQSDLQVESVSASYAASGEWALLRLIEKHRPKNGFIASNTDPNRLLLEFLVPVVSKSNAPGKITNSIAKLYLGLNLSGKDPITHAQISLKLPLGFPYSAP